MLKRLPGLQELLIESLEKRRESQLLHLERPKRQLPIGQVMLSPVSSAIYVLDPF
jgi:hypothetical protein